MELLAVLLMRCHLQEVRVVSQITVPHLVLAVRRRLGLPAVRVAVVLVTYFRYRLVLARQRMVRVAVAVEHHKMVLQVALAAMAVRHMSELCGITSNGTKIIRCNTGCRICQ
jgi:hypothetical protein